MPLPTKMNPPQGNGFCMPTGFHKRFRVKLLLTDGRKIYVTDSGKFQLVEGRTPLLDAVVARGRYTKALSLFSAFDPKDPNTVGVSSAELEPEASPVDSEAFIIGGALATTIVAPPN
jgi:hypothetical protein